MFGLHGRDTLGDQEWDVSKGLHFVVEEVNLGVGQLHLGHDAAVLVIQLLQLLFVVGLLRVLANERSLLHADVLEGLCLLVVADVYSSVGFDGVLAQLDVLHFGALLEHALHARKVCKHGLP